MRACFGGHITKLVEREEGVGEAGESSTLTFDREVNLVELL